MVDGSGAAFVPGPPSEVLILRAFSFAHAGIDYTIYAVSQDGQRFLYFQLMPATTAAGATAGPDPPSGLMVAMHWADKVK